MSKVIGDLMDHQNHTSAIPTYTCPMHPEMRKNQPGRCTRCGMHLVKVHMESQKHDHDETQKSLNEESHHDHMMHIGPDAAREFLRRFLMVTALLIPLFIFSMVGQIVLKYPDFIARPYIELGVATVIFGFGLVFFKHAKHEFLSRQFGMMTLVSIAIGSGYVFSVASTFIPSLGTEFNLEVSTLIWVLLFGHYLEAKSSAAAGNALEEVAKLLPKQAHLKRGEISHEVDISELQEGDVVIIKPGEKAPADGVIVSGHTHFNEAHISGESKPVEKHEGDRVMAGAIAEEGSVEVKLDKVGENSTVGQIQRLIASAKLTKPSAQRIADTAAGLLTLTAVSVALLTIVVWSIIMGQPIAFSVTLAITVLVIACPHALGLAIPTVATIATKKAINHGIFIKDLSKLEAVRKTSYVIFDKTGTLTQGSFGVSEAVPLNSHKPEDIVSIAASFEQQSSHVIGRSIVNYAQLKQLPMQTVKEFTNIPGKGVQGKLNGQAYWVGNETFLTENDLLSGEIASKADELKAQGRTLVFVATRTEVLGIIGLADQIKPEAKKAIDDLHNLNIKVAMITGDNEGVAKSVAERLGVDTYFANVLPQDKYTHVKALQDRGNVVLMVGDGVNDAPALTQANVGIAIGAGTDVAVEAGDVVLTQSNPNDIPALIILSKKVYQKMYQNLWWALGYNIIAIPSAAGVFIPYGFQLSPQVGAIAMALSSVIVVINAMTLRKASLTVS